jgi:hypothetical protein
VAAVSRVVVLCLLLAAAGGLLAGCGGDEEDRGSVTPPESTRAGFPDRKRTLLELRGGVPAGPVLSPAVTVLRAGPNRLAFRLLDPPREAPRPDGVAVYTARPDGRGVRGPFLARRESLRVPARFRSRRVAGEPRPRDLWVAEVAFPGAGRHVVTALVRDGEDDEAELRATNQLELRVAPERAGPPAPGDRAIPVHTDRADTRRPPLPALHRTDLADALGRRPLVLVFASPGRCPTPECAQAVDAAATVRAQTGVEVVHQETFRSEDLEDGFRDQVVAWRLPTPAWTFVIDADGRVADRFEGAVSVRELRSAVERVGAGG